MSGSTWGLFGICTKSSSADMLKGNNNTATKQEIIYLTQPDIPITFINNRTNIMKRTKLSIRITKLPFAHKHSFNTTAQQSKKMLHIVGI